MRPFQLQFHSHCKHRAAQKEALRQTSFRTEFVLFRVSADQGPRFLGKNMMKMQTAACVIAALVFFAAAPSGATTQADAEMQQAAQWLAGRFDNEAQARLSTETFPDVDGKNRAAQDAQFAAFTVFTLADAGTIVLYTEWRAGAADGPISRQRVWSFYRDAEGKLRQRFYTIRTPERFAGAAADPAKLAALTMADLIPFPPACDLVWTKMLNEFLAEIPPGQCFVTTQATKQRMFINARIALSDRQMFYDESGTAEDGRVTFNVPVVGSYQFRKSR